MPSARERFAGTAVIAAVLVVAFAAATTTGASRSGDPVRGAKVYDRCVACHSLERNRTGPRHCGLIGRRAGSVPGFEYSDAMRRLNIIWTRKTLDGFLKAPLDYVPGTAMGYSGIKDPKARADLIAFLETAKRGSKTCR